MALTDDDADTGPEASARPHRARRGEGERLREEILDATERLLIETGDADAVSVRRVAEAVGRTPPSLYLHFSTRDELVHAVCERQFDVLTATFERACEGIDDPVERIRRMGRAYVDFGLEHPEQYRIVMMHPPSFDGDVKDLDELSLVSCFAMVVEAIEEGVASGALLPTDPAMAGIGLWAGVHGLASLLISHHHMDWPPLDDLVDRVVEQCLTGLLAR